MKKSDLAANLVEAAEPSRYLHAVQLGLVADEEFADQCAARRVSVEKALAAPLDYMELPAAGVTRQ